MIRCLRLVRRIAVNNSEVVRDLVLAGDVFYERSMAGQFLTWGRGLASRGIRVLAGDPGRLYSPREGVVDRGVHVHTLHREAHHAAGMHRAAQHPMDQSLRGGTQTVGNLFVCGEPAICWRIRK